MKRILQVYLAGPITGCTYEGATDWREFVIEDLEGEFICLSPMRAKEYLTGATDIAKSYDAYDEASAEGEGSSHYRLPDVGKILSCNKGINRRDSWDCRTADILLVNLHSAPRVSVGTVLEIGMAWSARKPVIAVMEGGNIHEHPMISDMVDFRCPDLDIALEVLRSLR